MSVALRLLGSLTITLAGSAMAAEPAADLELGRALFEGKRQFAQVPTVAGAKLPLANAHCAGCHGTHGQGRTEAGVTAPPLQWRTLNQARAQWPAFRSADHVMAAIEQGQARSGSTSLAAPMPRFALTDTERRALQAYLQVLGTEAAPVRGVSATQVLLGTALPLSGAEAAAGQTALAAMRARMVSINLAGGIFGRSLELRVVDSATQGIDAAVQALITQQHVFALVGTWLADPSDSFNQTLQTSNTPNVGAIGMPLATQQQPLTTHLLPSVQQQIGLALGSLQKRCDSALGSEVWHGSTRSLNAVGLKDESSTAGAKPSQQNPRAIAVAQAEPQLTQALRERKADKLVMLLPAAQIATVQPRLEAAQWCFATLASVSGMPRRLNDDAKQVVVFPVPPRAIEGGALWGALGHAAMGLMAEGLSRAGRVLDAQRLTVAVDSLRDFEAAPGFTLRLGTKTRHALGDGFVWQQGSAP